MFALLIPLLAQLPGIIGNFFKQKNDLLMARDAAQLQVELAKQTYAGEIAKGQLELNATIVSSTGSQFKYFTFFMWFGPFMVGTLFPKYGDAIFNNLARMPEWYVQSCMLIMFTVWGISVSAPVVSGIFSGLGSFFDSRRDHKLELAKVDRKTFYDALRLVKGVVSPDDMKTDEKIFDTMDKNGG